MCEACDRAELNPRTGYFNAGCLSCSARALAGDPAHMEAQRAQTYTPSYMNRLHAMFGMEWQAGHEAVKRWSDRLRDSGSGLKG